MLKERSLEVSIISLIFLVVIILFGFKPIIKNLHVANLDAKVKKETLDKKQAKLDNLNSMKAQLGTLKENLNLMKKALPKTEDMPAILVSIEAIAGQSGLGITTFSPSSEKNKTAVTSTEQSGETGGTVSQTVTQETGVASLTSNISLQGGYPSLITFLENVEKNMRPTTISTVRISGGAKDKPQTIAIIMVSYYQK